MPHPFLAAFWFLLLGGLLAADAKLSLRVTTALAALLGIYHGYSNGAGMGQFDTAAVALLGLAFSVFILIALSAAFVVRLRAPIGSNCRASRWKLDRCQRSLDARLGNSNALRQDIGRVLLDLYGLTTQQ